jgi:hypothetical protein
VLRPLLALIALSLAAAACGVDFSEDEPGTEFWQTITISGELRAGAPLQVTASYEQFYPADLEVQCEVRQEATLIKAIGAETIPALAAGTPESTPVAGHVTYDFTIDEPGAYTVECLTPKDEDNFINDEVEVAG